MLTNADITIYNKYYDMNDKCTKYKRSYLQGVNYKISDGVCIIIIFSFLCTSC